MRWGFLDEMIPVSWVHLDELWLGDLKRRAYDEEKNLEVITGSAPGRTDPWTRARWCHIAENPGGWGLVLLDEEGFRFDDRLHESIIGEQH